ncbi:MAG: hypothetical protein H7325_05585 [Pedobacter sp.]|nr:hypothetical protein [Pedobacter sp.]
MSFHPCADNFSVKENLHTETVDKTVNHQDQSQDECSPFCGCACCSVRAIAKNSNTFAFHLQINSTKDTEKIIAQPIDITVSIWQPPKLV